MKNFHTLNQKEMSSFLNNLMKPALEGFVNPDDSKEKKESYIELAAVIISFFIALIVLSLIGKFLWNGVVTKLFTCVRPADSFMQILGLFVFVSLLT